MNPDSPDAASGQRRGRRRVRRDLQPAHGRGGRAAARVHREERPRRAEPRHLKKQKPFHNPFQGLKLPKAARAGAARPPPAAAAEAPSRHERRGRPVPRRGGRGRAGAPGARPRRAGEEVHGFRPGRTRTPRYWPSSSELVAGDAPFDLSDSDEFIEGHLPSLDPQLLRKLRKGEIAVQGHVDLHGLTRDEAKATLERFLLASAAGREALRPRGPRAWARTARIGFRSSRPASSSG